MAQPLVKKDDDRDDEGRFLAPLPLQFHVLFVDLGFSRVLPVDPRFRGVLMRPLLGNGRARSRSAAFGSDLLKLFGLRSGSGVISAFLVLERWD